MPKLVDTALARDVAALGAAPRTRVVDLISELGSSEHVRSVVSHNVEPKALAALKAGGIAVRKQDVHDEGFIVFGKYGSAYGNRVYTGSHDLSISANTRDDEIFVKLPLETGTSHLVYDAFLSHFNDVWAVATAP